MTAKTMHPVLIVGGSGVVGSRAVRALRLAALHFAKEFPTVQAIEIGAVFDEVDVGGPAAQADGERLARGVPHGLILKDGKWFWAQEKDALRTFTGVDGTAWEARAYPLLDVVSLAAATEATSVRMDFAVRKGPGPHSGTGPSHEVIIEILGKREDGTSARVRHELVDSDVHAGMSGRGAALATERLLGLAGGPPVRPGLYTPEGLLDPSYVVGRMKEFGTRIRRQATDEGQ